MIRNIDDLGRIVIPKEMRKELGVDNGEGVNIELIGNKVIITKPDTTDYEEIVKKLKEYIEDHDEDLYTYEGYIDNGDFVREYDVSGFKEDILKIINNNKD